MKNNMKYDKLSLLDIDDIVMLKRKQKYLEKHKYAIWQSDDGKYWYTTFPDATKRRGTRQIRRHSRLELEEAIIEFWENFADGITVEDLFHEWNDKRLELKKISPNSHLRNEQVFNKYCQNIKDKDIRVMIVEDFVNFLEEQIPIHSLTSKAFSSLKSIIRGVVKIARRKNLIDFTDIDVIGTLDISDRAFKKEIKEDSDEVFDEEEMPKMINYLVDNFDDIRNVGILLMFVTGIRVGELVTLKHSDFDENVVKIRKTETKIPKDGGGFSYEVKEFPKTRAGVRDVVVPAGYEWLIKNLSYGKPDEFVFKNDKGERLTTNSIRRRLTTICKELGIVHKSPHKIRKTYGSILLDNNVDRRLIMTQMGHSDIRCTETNYHRNRRNNKKKSEIISNIPDFKST